MTFEIIFVLLALVGMVIADSGQDASGNGAFLGCGVVPLCGNPDT